MSFLHLRFHTGEAQAIDRLLGVAVERIGDLTPAFRRIAKDFTQRQSVLFKLEGNAEGFSRWKPLSPAYAEQKQRAGFGSKILVRTGRLRDSLTQLNHADTILNIQPRRLEIGTKVPYAKYHTSGTAKMPARPPIRVTEAQKRFWVHVIQAFLLQSDQFERRSI